MNFIELVEQMRSTQKEYFKARSKEALERSKALEREVDLAIAAAKRVMWIEFYFESNAVFGPVSDSSQWLAVKEKYAVHNGDKDIYRCRRSNYSSNLNGSSLPNFGQRMEHQGDETLGDFFDLHGMQRI